ncbi:MAG: hypothetical protein IGS54_11895 [Elainella sp. C42_A2020_010]|nr:hypothetical protein [Elainella sp. C42_A2020_010]RNJ66192.1 MAG: hypothetical protein EDM05_27270 [Leptolyngbya sp. IPPAS B-1204]
MLPPLHLLLTSIVDYAGLFPPAQLNLSEAMATYAQAQSSPQSWMLNCFILPATHLSNWIKLLPQFSHFSIQPWPLSVILSQNWTTELEQIQSLIAAEKGDRLQIRTLEVAPLPPSTVASLCRQLPPEIEVFFEIPFDAELEPYLQTLHQTGRAAKLRTGGINSDQFPDSSQLAQRILALAEAAIPFKATAGLHHPLRGRYALTYAANSPTATMHGFLNLAILAASAYQHSLYQQSLPLEQAVALLEETSLAQFQFSNTAISWRNQLLSTDAIAQTRQLFFRSFGSCSYQDPITDLEQLKLL